MPDELRYFLLVALLAKETRERLPLSMPRLPSPIRQRKYYAQVDTPDLGGMNRVALLRAFFARSTQWLSMVAILLKA